MAALKLLWILGLMSLVPGLAAFIWGEAAANIHSHWPTVRGVITAVETHFGSDDNYFVASFEHRVADGVYHGRQKWLIARTEVNSDGELQGYSPGTAVMVHYKPTNPDVAAINLDELDCQRWGGLFFVALGAVTFLFGGVCWVSMRVVGALESRRCAKVQERIRQCGAGESHCDGER